MARSVWIVDHLISIEAPSRELCSAALVGGSMNKLNSGFSKLPDEDLDNAAQSILAALTGNANFSVPVATLAALGTEIQDYQTALALPPGAPRDAQVKEARADLSASLDKLARTLELTAGVTDAMLATSGFELRKQPAFSSGTVAAPGNVRIKQTGVSGVVQVLCEAVDRAQAYELQYTLDPNAGPWLDGGTFVSTRGIGITGLTRSKDYWARLRAVGTSGPGAWSDPATVLVA